MKDTLLVISSHPTGSGGSDARLTVMQRFGSSLNLNVHFHTIAMDGVYARQPDGSVLFHPLPAPGDEDVARIARSVCRKVARHLRNLKGADDDRQATLDNLANASVQGLVATGPRRGCRVLRLGISGEDAEAMIMGKRCAAVAGFNVHANVRVGANDRDGLEHLCRYLARPPIANDRLQELPDGRLALRFKQAWRDGTTHIVFTPHELIEKLIPLIPRPRSHLVRYHGILGPADLQRRDLTDAQTGAVGQHEDGTVLGRVGGASRRATSEPLKISGQRRGTLARGMEAVTSPTTVARSRQRMAARFTLRVRGERPLLARSRRKLSTSSAVTAMGGLPA